MANPDIALLLAVVGLLGIYAEFLRPGMIVPGVAGSALVAIAAPSVRHAGLDPTLAWALLVPLGMITGFLLRVAAQARRNKLDVSKA
jgi:membrane-bound ClpP family serine protease